MTSVAYRNRVETYKARHEYVVDVVVKGKDSRLKIGKVLNCAGVTVYFRKEPLRVAVMRNCSALSVDLRCLPQWLKDGVKMIHLVDKDTGTLYSISYDDWLFYCFESEYGAGRQSYVDLSHFRKQPWFYKDGYTPIEKHLDPLPRAEWENLEPPEPPTPPPSQQQPLL